jgi:deoxycytidine triphosphate deaminase
MPISNTKILKELGRGNIGIHPLPSLEDFDACNVNLHLGATLLVWPMDVPYVVDHRREHIADAWKRHGIPIDLSNGKSHKLRVGEKCLALTQEHLKLPTHSHLNRLLGWLRGQAVYLGHLSNRSWAGRSFIRSAVDAFEIKPGTDNQITLEIISDFEIELYEGMPFIQISFERVHGRVFNTNGWVHGQKSASGGENPKTVEFDPCILGLYEQARKANGAA